MVLTTKPTIAKIRAVVRQPAAPLPNFSTMPVTALNAVFYTANGIAYSYLVALITKNNNERVQLGSFRFMFAVVTNIFMGFAVGSMEHCVQCRVHDEEVDILHGGAASRDGKQQKQAEGNTYLTKQHLRTCLAQLGEVRQRCRRLAYHGSDLRDRWQYRTLRSVPCTR